MKNILVDGYNLHYAAKAQKSFNFAHDIHKLIYLLEKYAAQRDAKITVVLDGTRLDATLTSTSILKVLFSDPGQTADAVLERLMAQCPDCDRQDSWIITSDHNLTQMARGSRWAVVSSNNFLQQLQLELEGKSVWSVSKKEKEGPFNNPFSRLL